MRVGTLGKSHIGYARGGDLGLVVRSHDKNVMCLRGGECNTPRAQRRVVHIEDMKERKQHQLDTFWAECRQRTLMLSVLDLGKPRDG